MSRFSDKAREGESGLADRYQLTVTKSRFGFPFPNAAETCALILDGERNIDGTLDDGHLWLKVGAFEPGDKEGTFAIHESQDVAKFFNKNSGLGKFLKSAFEAGVPLEENQPESQYPHETRDALMWEGLILDIEEKEEEFTLRQGPDAGKVVTSRSPKVVAFVGKADGTTAPATAATTTPAASGNGSGDVGDLASFDSHMSYVESAVAAGKEMSDLASKDDWQKARAAAGK